MTDAGRGGLGSSASRDESTSSARETGDSDSPVAHINLIAAVLLGLTMFAFTLAAVFLAWNFRGASRLAPLIIGIPMLALLTAELQKDLRRLLAAQRSRSANALAAPPLKLADQDATATTERNLLIWFVVLSVLVVFFGFYVAIVAFTVAFLRFGGRHSLRLSVIHALLSVGSFYLLMEVVFRMRIFKGLLFA